MAAFAEKLAQMSAERQAYTLREGPSHLAAAGQQGRLERLLTTFDFLQAKIIWLGPSPLINDYELTANRHPSTFIQEALRLASDYLSQEPYELASQLIGRLMPFDEPEIQNLLDEAGTSRAVPWFRPLTPCLTPPGGSLLQTLGEPYHTPWFLAITRDSRYLLSGGPGSDLIIWELDTGAKLEKPDETRLSTFQALAVTPDGRWIISVPQYPNSSRKHIQIHTLESRELIRELSAHNEEVTDLAVTSDGHRLVSASKDQSLCVWDLDTGNLHKRLEGHQGAVTGVVVGAKGKRAFSAGEDRMLRIWDLERGQELGRFSVTQAKPHAYSARKNQITALAVTEDGRYLAAGRPDGTIQVWDLVQETEPRILEGHRHQVNTLAPIPGKAQIVSGAGLAASSTDNTVRVWDLEQGRELRSFSGHTRWVSSVVATPNGQQVLSGGIDGAIRIWNPAMDQSAASRPQHERHVMGLAIDADGRIAVSASLDHTLKVWELARHEVLHTLRGHSDGVNAVAVAPDGRYAYSASADKTLRKWDLYDGDAVGQGVGHSDEVSDIAITPDGELLLSASQDGTVQVWTSSLRSLGTLESYSEAVQKLAITGDGRRVLSGCWNAEIRVSALEARTASPSRSKRPSSGWLSRLLRRNQGDEAPMPSAGQTKVRFWPGQDRIASFRTEFGINQVTSLAVSSDGRYAAAGNYYTGVVEIWDLNTRNRINQLRNGPETFGLTIQPDSKHLLIAAADGSLSLWHMVNGKLLARLHLDVPASACLVTQDGLVITGDQMGRVHFLHLEGVN